MLYKAFLFESFVLHFALHQIVGHYESVENHHALLGKPFADHSIGGNRMEIISGIGLSAHPNVWKDS